MGTRSTTLIREITDSEPVNLLHLYRQFDGYADRGVGHAWEMCEFITGAKCVNGIGPDNGRVFNGPRCFAAQLLAHFKTGPGKFYVYPMPVGDFPGASEKDYNYVLTYGYGYAPTYETKPAEDHITVDVYAWGKPVFSGTIKEMHHVLKILGGIPFSNEYGQSPLIPKDLVIDTPKDFRVWLKEHKPA